MAKEESASDSCSASSGRKCQKMRVRTKFISITLFVAAVPLLMSASQSIRVHEKTLNDILLQLHGTSAELGAQAVQQHMSHTKAGLRTIVQDTIDWEALSSSEKQAAMQLILSQSPDALTVTLEQQDGEILHLSRHRPALPAPVEADIVNLRSVLPPTDAEVAIGSPIQLVGATPLLPLSISDHTLDGRLSATIGVALTLDKLCATLERAHPEQGSVFLVDARNRLLCENGTPSKTFEVHPSLTRAIDAGQKVYTRESPSEELRGAVAKTTDGFSVIVEQPLAILAAPTRLLRGQVALWLAVGALAAIASGFILGRSILEPLERLAAAAARIGAGIFGERIKDSEFDAEFAELATSFNTMSHAIAERDREIQEWNQELQRRIDQRSRELEAAQDALLSSRKMAGLSVTTAGVAHELNNPLTGVLGLAQVLVSRLKRRGEASQDIEILTSIVGESKRMQALLERMKVLHSDPEHSTHREVSCSNLLEGALMTRKRELEQQGITVVKPQTGAPVFVWGHLERLHMVFVELLENAHRALRESVAEGEGRIVLEVNEVNDDWVEIAVEDNGPGIPDSEHSRVFEPFFTTKPGGVGQGLGLSQVYRMVEAHSGKVWISSDCTTGCRIVVRLPRARVGAHLV